MSVMSEINGPNDAKDVSINNTEEVKECEVNRSVSTDGLLDEKDKGHRRYLPMLLFMVIFYIGTMGAYILLPQFILYRFKLAANLTDDNSTSPCTVNKSDPRYLEEQNVQAKSSRVVGAISFASGIPCIFTVFLFGAVSDRYGRRLVIMVNLIGLLLSNLMMTFIITLDLSIMIYIVFAFFNGITGSYSALVASVFAYAADVTTRQQRNVAVAVMQFTLGISMVITSLLMGFWIQNGGFDGPMIGMTVMTGISGIFLFFVKETRRRATSDNASVGVCRFLASAVKTQFYDIKRLLVFKKRRSACLLLITATFLLHSFVTIGTVLIKTLYLMNQPFCWGSSKLGVYNALHAITTHIGSFLVVFLLRNRVSDVVLIIFGLSSSGGTFAFLAVSSLSPPPMCDIFAIIAVVFGFMSSVSPILLRAAASKLVSVDEQGAVFGLIATGEAIAIAIGPTVMSAIYSGSVVFMKGFVYFVACGVIGLSILLMFAFRIVLQPLIDYGQLPSPAK